MQFRNVTREILQAALDKTNEEFAGNITFKRIDPAGYTRQGGEKWIATLTVHDSRQPGGRIGQHGRRIAAACWHAHGTFFDSLPTEVDGRKVEIVTSGRNGSEITYPGAVWEDRNIGSQMFPMMYSTACDC